MESKVNSLFLLLLLLLPSISLSSPLQAGADESDDDNLCVYTVYIRTGSIWKGGTDSVISLRVNDTTGASFAVANLESWGGLMGAGHNYYERGNLDVFSGRGPCLRSAPCAAELASDGSGPHHGWYCNYVEVTATGPHMGCSQKRFDIEQWLARDAPPYKLTAVRDYCSDNNATAPAANKAAEVSSA